MCDGHARSAHATTHTHTRSRDLMPAPRPGYDSDLEQHHALRCAAHLSALTMWCVDGSSGQCSDTMSASCSRRSLPTYSTPSAIALGSSRMSCASTRQPKPCPPRPGGLREAGSPREACERGAAAAHPEDLASGQADRAGPDDAHRLGAQLEADQAGQGVVALAHPQVRMLQVPAGAGLNT